MSKEEIKILKLENRILELEKHILEKDKFIQRYKDLCDSHNKVLDRIESNGWILKALLGVNMNQLHGHKLPKSKLEGM